MGRGREEGTVRESRAGEREEVASQRGQAEERRKEREMGSWSVGLADANSAEAQENHRGSRQAQEERQRPNSFLGAGDEKERRQRSVEVRRRRDCHSAAPPSTVVRCFNMDEERERQQYDLG